MSGAEKPVRRPLRLGVVRVSAFQFLISLILWFASTPLIPETQQGRMIESALFTFVLLSGALAVGWHRHTFFIAGILVFPAVLARWADHFWPDLVPWGVPEVCGLIFVIFVAAKLLQFVLRAPRVNAEVLCAGVSDYILLGLIWSFAYVLVSQTPGSFTLNGAPLAASSLKPFEAFYFSFVTLTTVGYGDLAPLSRVARTLAAAEAMTGTLYVAVMIARLVALYSSEKLDEKQN